MGGQSSQLATQVGGQGSKKYFGVQLSSFGVGLFDLTDYIIWFNISGCSFLAKGGKKLGNRKIYLFDLSKVFSHLNFKFSEKGC